MLFKKLFQVLVVGGTMMGASQGCVRPAEAAQKKGAADAGAATAPDAGSKAQQDTGGGAPGW